MDKRIQRYKRWVNINFFKSWSNNMAYVLGYFCADGGMFLNSGKSKYIQFISTDYEHLYNVRTLLLSRHKITEKKRRKSQSWKKCYVLQIGSKEIYDDLAKIGLTPNKEKSLKFPNIPDKYIKDFTRGYFDGDGCISSGFYKRHDRKNKIYKYFSLKFACGSKIFLRALSDKLSKILKAGKGSLVAGKGCNWLSYSKKDAFRLLSNFYKDTSLQNRLQRKYLKFKEAFQI